MASARDKHKARAYNYSRRQARASAMKEANIDTAGLDPEMRETLGGEAARRVGARGIGVRTKNPFDMFKRGKKRPKP